MVSLTKKTIIAVADQPVDHLYFLRCQAFGFTKALNP